VVAAALGWTSQPPSSAENGDDAGSRNFCGRNISGDAGSGNFGGRNICGDAGSGNFGGDSGNNGGDAPGSGNNGGDALGSGNIGGDADAGSGNVGGDAPRSGNIGGDAPGSGNIGGGNLGSGMAVAEAVENNYGPYRKIHQGRTSLYLNTGCSFIHQETKLIAAVLLIRFRIQIRRIRMFLGLLDPEPLVRGMDLDPFITNQKE
jgi:PPE-repeat protein